MEAVKTFLTRTRGVNKLDISDILTYLYLGFGVILMFGPVLWVVLSSFKSSAEVVKFPPRLLPYRQQTVEIEGHDEPLPLYTVELETGDTAVLAQVRRVGLEAQMIDPADPNEIIRVNIDQRTPVESVYFGLENYIEGVQSFDFAVYLRNSVVVTVTATLLTLLVNQGRVEQQPAGRNHPRRCDPDRCLPPAAIYADHPGRAAGRSPHRRRKRMAYLRPDCAAPGPPSPGSFSNLLDHVALE